MYIKFFIDRIQRGGYSRNYHYFVNEKTAAQRTSTGLLEVLLLVREKTGI